MDKEKVLDKRKQKEIKDLGKQKNKAKEKNDLIEAAKICNCIGEILAENGFFEDAVREHKEEIYFSEASHDTIGVAVGNRKVGECLCEMGCFEEALEHQQTHLKIAKSVTNHLEQQRALATIGRTYFVQAESLTEDDDINASLMKSQEAYLRSLDICSNLGNEVSEKEILEMKARLYLNLGLIYDYKLNYNEAMRFVCKALVISREQKLQDNVFRCHLTLFGLYLNNNNLEKSLQSSKAALMIAQKENNKGNEMESLAQMGLALLRLGDFVAALNTLKKVYKFTNETSGVDPIVATNLKLAMKGIKFTTDYEKCEDKKELLSLCDKLGDLYSELGAPEKALKYYLQQLQIAEALNLSGKSLASIYISVAVTYSECKQYDKALEYHLKELNVKHGELAEKSSSYCAIATCLENLDSPFQEIKDAYMKALECAQGSGNHIAEMRAYRDWSETLHSYGFMEEYENVKLKMKHISKEYDISETVENESQHQEQEENCNLQTFSEGELLMLESDEEDAEEIDVSINNRKSSCQVKKVNKVNERGETPLHCAAISGNFDKAKALLQQGASVSARDYCGWQPLHEACNHGHADIAKLLIQHHADVNDPGGQHCGNITPLHDASQNGHIKIVQLLVASGASICAKTKEGLTPLELVRISIKADEEEFCNNSEETTIIQKRKQVEQFLLIAQKQLSHKQIPEISKNRNDKLFGDMLSDSENDEDVCQLPAKKKKLDRSRWEDMHNNLDAAVSLDRNDPPLIVSATTVEDLTSDSQSIPEHFLDSDEDISSLSPSSQTSFNVHHNFILGERRKQNNVKCKNKKSRGTLPIHDNTTDVDFRKTSVCTSLLSEGNIPIKDFIIDDMSTKRKRQSKIKYFKELDCIQSKNSNVSIGINKVKKKNIASKYLKQKRIEGYAEIDVTDTDSNDSNPPEISSRQAISQHINSTNQQISNKQTNLFRIKVRINQQVFLISIQNGNEATIEWLLNEAKGRYHNFCGISTKLLLKTRDGALLNPSDIIMDVIMNNEELIGEVIGLDFPPVIERYRTACKAMDIGSVPGIEEQLSFDQNFSDLHLRDIFLSKPALEAIFTSISCSMSLTTIDVSRTFIGDVNFSPVVNALHTLPSISTLKFSCTGITTKSLQDLARMLLDGIKDEFKLIMKEPPLFHLTSLHLDNNDFENQSQFIMSMGQILCHCKHLTDLNLESCQLGSAIFDSQSRFRSALKESRVSSLNLSDNNMGGNDFISNVFNSINQECIRSLDLSRTLSSHKEGFALKNIWKKLEDLQHCLKELKLDSLPNCFIDDAISNVSIEKLSIRYQISDFDSLTAICRCCMQINNLTHLDLSFSKNVNNDLFEFILQNLKTNVSMKNLLLNCCSVKSPFSGSMFRRLSKLNSSGLAYLDLSYNEIEAQDKSKLFTAWTIVHGNYALQESHQWKCVLFVR